MKVLKTLHKINKLAVLAIALVSTTAASAQDRMAALAPSDVKMKTVDTLMLNSLRRRENVQSAATNLYTEWSNASVGNYHQEIPETFTVDLRHFCMPTTSRVITSNYGRRWGRMHKGIDVKVYTGDTIVAAFDGKVRIVKYEANGYGNYVVIRHNNGLETVYGHLSKSLVIENQRVRAGQTIGLGGNTGRSTGSHLHFETRLLGIAINPALMFDFARQDVKSDSYVFRRSEHVAQAGASRGAQTQQPKAAASVATPVTAKIQEATATPAAEKKAPVVEVEQQTDDNQTATTATKQNMHIVKSGDTLYSIATKNGLTVEELCRKNGIPTSYNIHPGDKLKLN